MDDAITVAWLAGFLEGDGSFTRVGRCPRIQAKQKGKEPLVRLQERFGGRVKKYYHKSRGRFYWVWTVNGQSATRAMLEIYPLMSKRRQEQIQAVLSLDATKYVQCSFADYILGCESEETNSVTAAKINECILDYAGPEYLAWYKGQEAIEHGDREATPNEDVLLLDRATWNQIFRSARTANKKQMLQRWFGR